MATSSPSGGFTFGMEMELYLKPKMNQVVSNHLAKHGLINTPTNGDKLTPRQLTNNQVAVLSTVTDMLNGEGIETIGPKELDAADKAKIRLEPYVKWQVTADSSLGQVTAGYCQYHHLH
jgi:hypothetical protein